MATRAIQRKGGGRRLVAYLVESKRLGRCPHSRRNPAVIQGSADAHRAAMRSSSRAHGGLITRQSGRNRAVVTWRRATVRRSAVTRLWRLPTCLERSSNLERTDDAGRAVRRSALRCTGHRRPNSDSPHRLAVDDPRPPAADRFVVRPRDRQHRHRRRWLESRTGERHRRWR